MQRCREYFTEKAPELSVCIDQADIDAEHAYAGSDYIPEDPELEWLALYRKICTELASKNVVLIHGSAVMADGNAYLFCAPSGTGKSTHTRLWRELLGPKAVMINDDKPLVRIFEGSESDDPGKMLIYGTPWNGKHRLGSNISAPLRSICFLERSEENHIERMQQRDAGPLLLKYIFRPADPAAMILVLDTASKIADLSAFWRLGCNMSPSAAETSYKAMSEALKGQ